MTAGYSERSPAMWGHGWLVKLRLRCPTLSVQRQEWKTFLRLGRPNRKWQWKLSGPFCFSVSFHTFAFLFWRGLFSLFLKANLDAICSALPHLSDFYRKSHTDKPHGTCQNSVCRCIKRVLQPEQSLPWQAVLGINFGIEVAAAQHCTRQPGWPLVPALLSGTLEAQCTNIPLLTLSIIGWIWVGSSSDFLSQTLTKNQRNYCQ